MLQVFTFVAQDKLKADRSRFLQFLKKYISFTVREGKNGEVYVIAPHNQGIPLNNEAMAHYGYWINAIDDVELNLATAKTENHAMQMIAQNLADIVVIESSPLGALFIKQDLKGLFDAYMDFDWIRTDQGNYCFIQKNQNTTVASKLETRLGVTVNFVKEI